MSPTSYQTAPPRRLIINNALDIVKPGGVAQHSWNEPCSGASVSQEVFQGPADSLFALPRPRHDYFSDYTPQSLDVINSL